MIYFQNYPKAYFLWGIAASLLLHATLAILFFYSSNSPLENKPLSIISVSIEPPPTEQSKRQYVTTPRKSEPAREELQTPLLSERDTYAAKEKLRRGDPEAGAVSLPQTAKDAQAPIKEISPQEAPQREQAATLAALPKQDFSPSSQQLSHLRLGTGQILAGLEQQREKKESSYQIESSSLQEYRAFTREAGSGARFLGRSGSSDFLPNLPDGDITLLNAKADAFAVFVRRVATRVFSQIRMSGWDTLRYEDIMAISRFVTFHAVLSPAGELLEINLRQSSGSTRFDDLVRRSIQRGAKDPNPPREAALADGNIHFVFQSRSWVRPSTDPRTGGFGERRWIMLGTGLE